MNPDLQNRKTIFLIFILVAVLGYFTLPRIQQYVPLIGGKTLAQLDAVVIPNEVTILSDREILSQKSAPVPEPPSYLVCSIDDDPEGTNAYGIYDPTDLAVTVNNLVRLNTKHLFLGTHLHWPDLPPIENNTLNTQLELLDSCILSTPLRRTANSVEIPPYLLDSSVALSEVQGNTRMLPKVNNLSLAPTLKIPNNCKIGFSQLESEPETSNIPLLAVWNDRVILSSLLLERLHHLRLSPDDIEVTVGKFVSLGNTGNIIPIDDFGYFKPTNNRAITEPHIISADITSVEKSPVETENAVLTAVGVKADSYRAIEAPVKQLTQLTLTPVYLDTVNYKRISWWVELLFVVVVAFLLLLAVKRSVLVFLLWALLLVGGLLFGSKLLSAETAYFAPILYLLFALIVCMVVFPFLKSRANFIHELIDNQHDLDDLSVLYKKEQFAQKDLTVAKLSARDRKHLRKQRRRERRMKKKLQKANSKTENDQ
ncbi:MAG: hypothetical protein ACSHX6_06700 [Akkermansiaceae bacterium]